MEETETRRKQLNITLVTMEAGTDQVATNKREIASPFISTSNAVQDYLKK